MNIIDPNRIDFGEYLKNISVGEAQSLKPSGLFTEEVLEMAEHGIRLTRPKLPWHPTHEYTRIKNGKLSIWAGENGSGKSLLLGQVINGLIAQGRSAVIASLEMLPKETTPDDLPICLLQGWENLRRQVAC